jgi:hypothetical protein
LYAILESIYFLSFRSLRKYVSILSKGGLLTSVVLITMAVTPLLGGVAESASKLFTSDNAAETKHAPMCESQVAEDAIVVCGYSSVGKEIVNKLGQMHSEPDSTLPRIVAFDKQPSLIDQILTPLDNSAVLFGDGENPEVLKCHGVEKPRAIFIACEDEEQVLAATTRLRTVFVDTPIYTRSTSRREARELKAAGAIDVVVEHDELARSAPLFLVNGSTIASDEKIIVNGSK